MARPCFFFVTCATGLVLTGPAWAQPAGDRAGPEVPNAPGDVPAGSPEDRQGTSGEPPNLSAEQPEASDPSAPSAAPQPPVILPPKPLLTARAQRPPSLLGDPTVVVSVLIDAEGRPTAPQVEQSLTPEADLAAENAVLDWRFSPATKDGIPVAARIRVEVGFTPPTAAPTEPRGAERDAASAGNNSPAEVPERHDHSGPDETDSHLQVTVHGTRAPRRERRSASDYLIHHEVLSAAPHREGQDLLSATPGLFIGRSEGPATAASLSLRGFDAGHGQDIAISVGGLPINLPSHIHGQGYADLGFLIAESVDLLTIKEGVRDPRQGDFAIAGSIDIGLGIDEAHRGLQLRSSYGSFNTFSQKLIWAPKEAQRESLGAAEVRLTGGYGENRSGQSGSGILQHRFGRGPVTFRVVGLASGANGQSAGVVRADDVDAGVICFSCVYPVATATGQATLNQRGMAGLFADYTGPEHASGSLGLWVGRDHFRSKSNFTGFTQRSNLLPTVSGRGDLFEQVNDTSTLGITGRYRTEAFEPAPWTHGTLEVGLDGRLDGIDQTQNLIDAAVNNQVWDRRIDAEISQGEVALWADLDWQFGEKLGLRVGGRASVMSFETVDHLGNLPDNDRPDDNSLPGYRRSSLGTFFGPRASLEYHPVRFLSLSTSYGEGYRSPQGRTLQEADETPFARARSFDLGTDLHFGEPLELSLAGFLTHLDEDVAFDPLEASLQRIGPTRRLGATLFARSEVAEGLLVSLSLTYVHASLLDAPPPTADNPSPPYQEGQLLPYVAPLTARLDSRWVRPVLHLAGRPLSAELKVGLSYLSERPLPYGQWASQVALLDAGVGLLWGPLDLGLSGYNLLNLAYANEAYYFVSNWHPEAPPSRLPAEHIAAGPPASVFVHLGLKL